MKIKFNLQHKATDSVAALLSDFIVAGLYQGIDEGSLEEILQDAVSKDYDHLIEVLKKHSEIAS